MASHAEGSGESIGIDFSTISTKKQLYEELLPRLSSLLDGERDWCANAANFSSVLYHALNALKPGSINWLGFYLARSASQLVLGPFQGKLACVRIPFGRGVCGTTAKNGTTTLVPNVHEFPGHIACDSASQSEIVVPIFNSEQRLIGVLDIDSPLLETFDSETDKVYLEQICDLIGKGCDWDFLNY